MDRKKALKRVINIYTLFGFFLILVSIVFVLIPTSPYIWYRLNSQATDDEITKITDPILDVQNITVKEIDINIPDPQPTLPEGYHILIPVIGVNSPISSNTKYEEALKNGSWIVPDYGTPEDNSLPIIIASHRFGYASWSNEKRKLISFYNLPKTKVGDNVHIYWDQKEYVYEIYKAEEKTYISDYEADLILYTCKYFNSPQRIFRYANRIE
ncbi:MAG: sortase [Candidatus Dojkabacteria bacterium]|nr:sortase [Candidatus Dojkabacteria bacterium]